MLVAAEFRIDERKTIVTKSSSVKLSAKINEMKEKHESNVKSRLLSKIVARRLTSVFIFRSEFDGRGNCLIHSVTSPSSICCAFVHHFHCQWWKSSWPLITFIYFLSSLRRRLLLFVRAFVHPFVYRFNVGKARKWLMIFRRWTKRSAKCFVGSKREPSVVIDERINRRWFDQPSYFHSRLLFRFVDHCRLSNCDSKSSAKVKKIFGSVGAWRHKCCGF